MLSVIIPTYNEQNSISGLVKHLYRHGGTFLHEVIVVDGGSTDHTVMIAEEAGAKVYSMPTKSRAAQMNCGAQMATGNVFYFVHADALPPKTFASDIEVEVHKNPQAAGCYRMKFNSDKKSLRLNSYFTRFNGFYSGGGDQTLFLTRSLFEHLGAYKESCTIMEDFEFTKRIKKQSSLKVLPGEVLISARKYEYNSYLRVNLANLVMITLFRAGAESETLRGLYKKMLNSSPQ